MRNRFGVDLAPRELFKAPTVMLLALLVETRLNEELLTSIWDPLFRRHVGLDANFFELGGHSAWLPPGRSALPQSSASPSLSPDFLRTPKLVGRQRSR
jgi:hypothetical protein